MSAAAIALVAVLAFAGTASAQAGDRLTYKAAKRLAVTLAEQQVRDRDVVSYHVRDAERIGRNRIVFAYDDRTANEVFCTAVIAVRRTVSAERTRTRARFRGQECDGIPSDALEVEAITRALVRDLRGTEDATEASLRRVTRSIRRCEDLDVPRARRDAAAAVIDSALLHATFDPNLEVLDEFATALGQVETSAAALEGGIAGWVDSLTAIRALPSFPDPCATLQRWEQADWAADEAPVDLAEFSALDRRLDADIRAIVRAGRYLASVGVFPRVARQFVFEVSN
jgi:hypothetical protein